MLNKAPRDANKTRCIQESRFKLKKVVVCEQQHQRKRERQNKNKMKTM